MRRCKNCYVCEQRLFSEALVNTVAEGPVPFTQPDTNTWFSRYEIIVNYKFGDRISAIKYLLELNYVTHGPDDRLIKNRTKPRYVHLPFIEGNPKVAVRKVIGWHKKSLPTEEDWEGMRADPDLEKELGEDWFFARSRMPRTWITKLNQRRRAAGLPLISGPPARN